MRKLILGISVFVLMIVLFSCKGGGKEKLLKTNEQAMYACVYVLKDGSRDQGPLMLVVNRRDSAGKILSDSIFGRRDIRPVLDSVTKRPVLDSSGFVKTVQEWVKIGRDSVYVLSWKNLDSLVGAIWPVRKG